MKLNEINSRTVRQLSNLELLSLHRRVHQLLALKKNKYSVDLKRIHQILVNEMKRRKIKHYSEINEQNINIFIQEKLNMKSHEIKILAMESCASSDLPSKIKLNHLKYIKEKADAYQCIGYILDGKFYNLNESGKQELKKRFLKEQTNLSVYRKTAMSALGGFLFLPGAAILYRAIRASFDKCSGACGLLKMNTSKRQYCMAVCKVKKLQQELMALEKLTSECNKVEDSERCKERVNAKINSLKYKLSKAKESANKLKNILLSRGVETKSSEEVEPGTVKAF